jgi:hypothetical protein
MLNENILPKLNPQDILILEPLRRKYPSRFYYNATKFLIKQMQKYVQDARVFRISIMGETRIGKSEVGSTIAFLYCKMFNQSLKRGFFKNIDIFKTGKVILESVDFNVSFVMGSQSDYIYTLRKYQQEGKMRFGQIWQIDEDREKIGGIGSMSEYLEIKNVNNITAKFMQCEIWITPGRLEIRNTPYGIQMVKKDIEKRVNWGLLYKIEMNPDGSSEKHFMGWVNIPLHPFDEFRMQYNEKKNKWIEQELTGSGDPRIEERRKVAEVLSIDETFCRRSFSGKTFALTKEQQITILERWINTGKTQNWNEAERYRIIMEARLLAQEKYIQSQNKEIVDFAKIVEESVKDKGDELDDVESKV